MMLIHHSYLWYPTPSGFNQNRWKQHPRIYILLIPLRTQYLALDLILKPKISTLGAEIQCLSFKLNLGEDTNMTHIQQGWFIDLIYDHPGVFSLHDEDLRFCEWTKHTILTTMDRPVYLVHCTIPPHLQREVHKCLDTWLQQGIGRPLQSPYASQVVIVKKKPGEIHLCIDYHKLNSIMVRDAFPLPRIDKALLAIHSSNWFLSFDLDQQYL